MSQDESHDESALAASCDLLLSCLSQVADPGWKFGEILLQLLAPAGISSGISSGGGGMPQLGAALMLVEHLVAGGHAGLSVAGGLFGLCSVLAAAVGPRCAWGGILRWRL
jgi:hypothetical protein